MPDLLAHLLTRPPMAEPCEALSAWWPRMLLAGVPFARGIDRAVAAGFAADRLGWAFVAGYHAALGRLVPTLSPDLPAALAATEAGGAHPRAITTHLIQAEDGAWRLTGTKHFVTLGRHARTLLVVASTGMDPEGRNALRLVQVDSEAPGVSLVTLPETPFAPEIEHAAATFEAVTLPDAALLPGDGYTLYLKPFRTIEDLHVVGAALGYLVAVSRRHRWPEALREELMATLVAVRALAAEDPASPAIHVAVAGMFRALGRGIEAVEAAWAEAPDAEYTRWVRDRGLLQVAARVRAQRVAAAWTRLGSG